MIRLIMAFDRGGCCPSNLRDFFRLFRVVCDQSFDGRFRRPPKFESPALMLMFRFPAILAVLFCGAVLRAETTLSFTLDDSYMTSAGVFRSDGSLIRTLWRKVRYAPGAHTSAWDGKTDSGADAPAGTYRFKVIYHNIDYTWEG